MNNDLEAKVYEKVQKEYDNFIEKIKQLPIDEIIERSYEINCKNEFLEMFYSPSFLEEELEVILKMKNSLDFMYNDWLHTNGGLDEQLRDNLADSLYKLVQREQKLKTNKDKEKER